MDRRLQHARQLERHPRHAAAPTQHPIPDVQPGQQRHAGRSPRLFRRQAAPTHHHHTHRQQKRQGNAGQIHSSSVGNHQFDNPVKRCILVAILPETYESLASES
jgi:hypothetical protein